MVTTREGLAAQTTDTAILSEPGREGVFRFDTADVSGTKASTTLTFNSVGTPGEKFHINGHEITLVAGSPTGRQVGIGGDRDVTAQNVRTYLNLSSIKEITGCEATGTGNVLTITAIKRGLYGNDIPCASAGAPAKGTLTLINNDIIGQSLTIGNNAITIAASEVESYAQAQIGNTVEETASNIADVIDTYPYVFPVSVTRVGAVLTLTAYVRGPSGNSIPTITSTNNMKFTATQLSGGVASCCKFAAGQLSGGTFGIEGDDPHKGFYVARASDPLGATGAYVRIDDHVRPRHFAIDPGNEGANAPLLQAMFDLSEYLSKAVMLDAGAVYRYKSALRFPTRGVLIGNGARLHNVVDDSVTTDRRGGLQIGNCHPNNDHPGRDYAPIHHELLRHSGAGYKAGSLLTLTGPGDPGDTITIGEHVIELTPSGATGMQVNIGATAAATALNLKSYIDVNSVALGVTAVANGAYLRVWAATGGTTSHAIVTRADSADMSFDNSTLRGGWLHRFKITTDAADFSVGDVCFVHDDENYQSETNAFSIRYIHKQAVEIVDIYKSIGAVEFNRPIRANMSSPRIFKFEGSGLIDVISKKRVYTCHKPVITNLKVHAESGEALAGGGVLGGHLGFLEIKGTEGMWLNTLCETFLRIDRIAAQRKAFEIAGQCHDLVADMGEVVYVVGSANDSRPLLKVGEESTHWSIKVERVNAVGYAGTDGIAFVKGARHGRIVLPDVDAPDAGGAIFGAASAHVIKGTQYLTHDIDFELGTLRFGTVNHVIEVLDASSTASTSNIRFRGLRAAGASAVTAAKFAGKGHDMFDCEFSSGSLDVAGADNGTFEGYVPSGLAGGDDGDGNTVNLRIRTPAV